MSMKKLLFFGGTFDPPHSGHFHLLKQALKRHHFDKIIIMPTALPPHKAAANYLPNDKRLQALRMLFANIHGVEISDWELNKGGKSYSVETIQYLQDVYKEYEIWFLMGSDMFLSFERWYMADRLAQMCTLIVAPRNKEDLELLKPKQDELLQTLGVKSVILQSPIVEKSSTEIRGGRHDGYLPLEIQYYLYGKSALEPLEKYLKDNLTPEKYEHSYRVAEYACQLARIHGADEAQVYLASLLHDATKCWGKSRQLSYLQKRHYKLLQEDKQAPQIYHQITGALFAGDKFRVRDRVILSAIKCHTTGRERMNMVDKILFLADSIEPARTYEGVEDMRRVAQTDLDRAVLMNFDRSIIYIVKKGFYLHPQTVAARNWMLKSILSEGKHGNS